MDRIVKVTIASQPRRFSAWVNSSPGVLRFVLFSIAAVI